MSNTSSTKTEKRAINKIENLIDQLDFLDHHFKDGDKGICWDGFISVYHGNIDCKKNWDGDIQVQIKGRTTNLKKLSSNWIYDITRDDLENYSKIDGTIFFGVRFLKDTSFKIYYKELLPKNLFDLLKSQNTDTFKVKLKEVKNCDHLEKICKNFLIDKEIQKKLTKEVFNCNAISVSNNKIGTFSTWSNGEYNPLTILGEEKFIYILDEQQKIIDVEYAEISEVSKGMKINIKTKNGKDFYYSAEHSIDMDGTIKISFGKAFCLNKNDNKFTINLYGSLKERIKQLEFLDESLKNGGFFIGNGFISLKPQEDERNKYIGLYESYLKIQKFCNNHNIDKDINIENWTEKDIKNLLIWIGAIDNNEKINIMEWDVSTIGSIQIKDIRFSIFADKLEDGSFRIYSIWNNSKMVPYQFRYDESENSIYTKNLYSIINKDAYMADDINIDEMKKAFDKIPLEKNEETLINLQALEALKAYDITNNIQLLYYAEFLLNKIKNFEELKDTFKINLLQIYKRLRLLTNEEIKELIMIREKNINPFFRISANILIGNFNEAEMEFYSLNSDEQKTFSEFPIYKLLQDNKAGD